MPIDLQVQNYPELNKWLKDCHGDQVTTEFFEEKGCKSLTVTDDEGPVMFVRLSPAWRVDIQFLPQLNAGRTALGLSRLVEYVKTLPEREFLFETAVPVLARFMQRFGVVHKPDTYSLELK